MGRPQFGQFIWGPSVTASSYIVPDGEYQT
jgi:hypothetical protein